MAYTAKRTDATWIEMDVATLDHNTQTQYQMYKQAYADMKAQRQKFEDMMQTDAGLPEGKRMVFGYNFGKLSVAIVDDDRKPAKAKQAKQSLADFIASQAQAGARA
jgi:hypothetical protein